MCGYGSVIHWCMPIILAVPAVSHAAHPLTTDDTNTQGQGRHQIELTAEHGHDRESEFSERGYLYSLVWSYGARDNVDLIVALPYLRRHTESDGQVTKASGLSDTGLAVKWRFYENGPFSMAFKPVVTLPSGDEDKGLGAEHSIFSAFLIATLVSAPWEWHGQVGYIYNRNSQNERDDLYLASTAVGWKLIDQLRIFAEIGTYSIANKAVTRQPVVMTAGLIYAVSGNFDLDVGYKKGLNDTEVDYTWQAGITVRF